MTKLILVIGCVLFFLILVFPVEQIILKVPFLVLLLVAWARQNIVGNQTTYFRPVLFLISIRVAKGIVWTTMGIIMGNEGAITLVYINLVWYVLFGILIALIRSYSNYSRIIQTLIFSALTFVIFDLAFILMSLRVLPYFDVSFFFNVKEFYFSYYPESGFFYLQTNHLSNLVFIFPLTFVLLVTRRANNNALISFNKKFLLVLLILEICLMIVSGRRIMWLTILATPVYTFCFYLFLKREDRQGIFRLTKRYLVFGAIAVFIAVNYWFIAFNISFDFLAERFSAAFDSNEESARFEQAPRLIDGFLESPIIGHGAAAELAGFERSNAMPWAFELSYQDDLFKTGLLGFGMFVLFVGGIFYYGIRVIWSDNDILMVGLLAGLLSFLIANATNPFLSSFDYFWPIFLPLAYINVCGLKSTGYLPIRLNDIK